MMKVVASVILVSSSAVSAQIVSYSTDNPSKIHGDPNKIVCERQEKIGTRLGGQRICLTVAEWQARQAADRDQLERTQSGARAPCGEPPCSPIALDSLGIQHGLIPPH